MPRHEDKFWRENRFPVAGVILLIIGIVWFLNELHIFTIDIPWIPLILIVVAIGILANRCCRRRR
jgi:hypothetical protein